MEIELYINDILAELAEDPHVEFTWQTTDYSEPTAVRNSFTKTVTIPRTPNNDLIFNHMADLRRMQHGSFNPSRRCPFHISRDGVLAEKGYAKLDNITKDSYQVTLYGGLSQFLFALTYDADGDKRSMSSLSFPQDLSFRINKETVKEAWDNITDSTSKWNTINFAVCYEGLPDSISTGKALVNLNNADYTVRQALPDGIATQQIASSVTQDGIAYTSTNGYVLADLRRERTGLEMRDLRSYLLRPVMSLKSIVNAISDPSNNGGYEVVLDPLFFSDTNPYWSRGWVTLPQLTGLDLNASSEDYTWDLGDSQTVNAYDTNWVVNPTSIVSSTPTKYHLELSLQTTVTGATDDNLYLSSAQSLGAIAVQAYGLDTEGNTVCGSQIIVLTNRSGDGSVYDLDRAMSDQVYVPKYSSYSTITEGRYQRTSGNTYKWSNTISLDMDTSESAPSEIRIRLTYLPYLANNTWTSSPKRKYVYPSISDDSKHYTSTASITGRKGVVYYDGEAGVHSGTYISQDTLLSGIDGTPADWLLSFTKTFGLYMVKDQLKDRISILARASYYNGKDKDISRMIDRGGETRIDPITFSVKTFTMGSNDSDKSTVEESYKNTYSSEYGTQYIDTGYDFDTASQELNPKNVISQGAMCLEKSNWFTKLTYDNLSVPSLFHDWATLHYTSQDGDDLEVNTGYPLGTQFDYLNDSYTTYYDITPRLQLHSKDNSHIERSGTLLFYNGMEDSANMGLWLTDDTADMTALNDGECCWLVTSSETDRKGNKVAISLSSIPSFSRYSVNKGEITESMDFGRNKELYIPDIRYSQTGDVTIYEHYWRDYFRDLYSVNTRRFECNIDLNGEHINPDWLRDFYYFDDSCWVLNKIDSYDITSRETCKCEFTKVNKKSSYTGVTKYEDYVFRVERGDKNGIISSDGTIKATVYLWSDMAWTSEVKESFATLSPSSGSSSTSRQTLTLTFQQNTTDERRTATCVFRRADGRARMLRVTQAASGESTEYIQLNPQTISIPMDTSSWSTSITVTSSSDWRTTQPSSGKWMTVSPSSGSKGETTVTITSQDNNTGLERTSHVMFRNSTDNMTMFRGTQSGERGDYVELSPDYVNFPWSGSQPERITVKSSGEWSVSTYPEWTTASKDGIYLTVEAQDNTDTISRTGYVKVVCGGSEAQLRVYQDAKPVEPTKTLRAIPASISFQSASGSQDVTVVSTDDWNIYSKPEWLACVKTSTGFTATAEENTEHSQRTGYVVLTSGTLSATVTVVQEGAAYTTTPLAWGTYATTGTTAPINVNGMEFTPEVSGDGWRLDFEDGITSTRYMFTGTTGTRAYKTISLDPEATVTGLEDMRGMFKNCKELETMEMTDWDVSQVKDFTSMFDGCSKLRTLRLSGWDVVLQGVQINYFLYGCSSLETVDLSGWAVTSSASMTQFFYGCDSLTTIYVAGCSQEVIDLFLYQLNTYMGQYTWTHSGDVITRG